MTEIELYALPGCPHCAKVERTLDDLDLAYERHEVPPSRAARDEVAAASGQRGVPVIVDPDHAVEGMAESDDIVAYLEETYGNGTGNGN